MVNSSAMKKMKTEIAEFKNGMAQKDEEIEKLQEENRAMKKKIERFLFCIPNAEKFLIRRALPAELLSELFASLPMENAFDILAKMPNGLLARNLRKMLKSIEMVMRNNKWNLAECGPKLAISERGLVVKHSGPYKCNSVRAQSTIPKFNLNAHKSRIAYFEVEIVAKQYLCGIHVGFCTQQFPLEGNWIGSLQNSIGIWDKEGIQIDGKYNSFGNEGGFFQASEIIGIGIFHFPTILAMKCFATCNGNLLGKVDLPMKFADLHLFPAVTMYGANESIRANFGCDPWQFYPAPEHFAN